MAHPIFLKYFTQSDQKRLQAGFATIDGKIKNEAERLKEILVTKKVLGGNQKGYFRYREQMLPTVSFTGAPLESLDQFFTIRSNFGFAILSSRAPNAKQVIYLDSHAIYCGAYSNEDKWRIDLARTPEECYFLDEQWEDIGELTPAKPYDFRWEQEWRLKVPHNGISFERVDFVLAPGAETCKRVNELFGQEAYDVIDHMKRVSAHRTAHQGRSPPLEEVLGKCFIAQNDRIKAAKPQEGIIIMPEIVESVWDEIRRS